ncbi:MAG: hypothetical protein DLM57_17065 [Pseudonocardiales bacterium]|nr:MAG: hypothetical protein DLM57_17065 [Pseudonocardiales bacterium]
MSESTAWAAYRAAWRSRPWLALIVVAAAVLIVVSVAQTFTRGPLAFLFIPGLALVYVHHLIVRRSTID